MGVDDRADETLFFDRLRGERFHAGAFEGIGLHPATVIGPNWCAILFLVPKRTLVGPVTPLKGQRCQNLVAAVTHRIRIRGAQGGDALSRLIDFRRQLIDVSEKKHAHLRRIIVVRQTRFAVNESLGGQHTRATMIGGSFLTPKLRVDGVVGGQDLLEGSIIECKIGP